MNSTTTIVRTGVFRDAPFMSAAEKRNVLHAWIRFVKSGFAFQKFTKALYNHLIQHCSFIAHYDRGGFYATYFREPEATQRFLDQFDRSQGCISVEYGTGWWLGDEDDEYHDINNAMIDAIEDLLPQLRRTLAARELENAEQQLLAAQAQVNELRARTKSQPTEEVKP